MITRQRRALSAEMKPTDMERQDSDNTSQVATDVPGVVTPTSVQPTVKKPVDEDVDFARDEIAPFYHAHRRPAATLNVLDETKDMMSALPVPDIPDVLSDEKRSMYGILGGLSHEEVCLSLFIMHVMRSSLQGT